MSMHALTRESSRLFPNSRNTYTSTILLAVLSVLGSASMILSFYKVGEMQKDMYNPHLCISTCSTPEKDRTEDKRKTVPVFYNVFTEPKSDGSLTKSIVEEQMKHMRAFHQVFVRSTGKPIQIENATILQHDDEGDESQTLGLLYQHCVENPSDTVVYLHSKGSFHAKEENNRLRRFLTRGALSEECAHMPDQCNICSSRFSPLPHPHTSGNMWVAKCVYVRKLINPNEFQQKMDDIYKDGVSIKGIAPEVVEKNHPPSFGLDRFAAEHWINSHPSAVPCDLASDDYKYTWNYNGVPDEDFRIDLKTAPRFEKLVYQLEFHHAMIDPLRIQQEYLALYNESTAKTWWGWDFYKSTYAEVVPAEGGARIRCNDDWSDLLWSGGTRVDTESNPILQRIEMCVAYCQAALEWIREAIANDFPQQVEINLTIMSKCNNEADIVDFGGLSNVKVEIIKMPNKGGCDLAYARFISRYLARESSLQASASASSTALLFLKDTTATRPDGRLLSLNEVVRFALQRDDFVCGLEPQCWVSAYHHVKTLGRFIASSYTRTGGGPKVGGVQFNPGGYRDLSDFVDRELNWAFPNDEAIQVCYGGRFAITESRLLNGNSVAMGILFRRLEQLLMEGSAVMSVVEHFVERLWAGILVKPLTPSQVEEILDLREFVLEHQGGHMGNFASKNIQGCCKKSD